MLPILIAIGLMLHGLIHLIGFVVNWQIVTIKDISYSTTVLAGKINLGDGGIRIVGVLWLLATIGYVVAGVGLLMLAPSWLGLTLWVTGFSLVLCILGWPEAQFGVYIDLIILAYLLFGGQLGWLP
jgi:hypothetical protein